VTRLLAIVGCAVALLAALAAPGAVAVPGAGKLLAPPAACPGQNQLAIPHTTQARAMRCLTNYARVHSGLKQLAAPKLLTQAAAAKARDILRCDDFSHEACGREFTYWMQNLGYLQGSCWGAAENIAWGTGTIGTARAIFRAWLQSPGHRENILGPYADLGVGLREGTLEGNPGAQVWVEEFGAHTC
jgi:uncharacterized protein YkwD